MQKYLIREPGEVKVVTSIFIHEKHFSFFFFSKSNLCL